jgi:hypothetical protein
LIQLRPKEKKGNPLAREQGQKDTRKIYPPSFFIKVQEPLVATPWGAFAEDLTFCADKLPSDALIKQVS